MNKTKFKIAIGDWSKDGHNQSEDFIIEANYTVEQLQEAYKNSCKLTTISFDDSVKYTGVVRHWRENKKFEIAQEYEDSRINEAAFKILKHFNVLSEEQAKYLKEGDYFIESPTYLVKLIMGFIKLSLPDLEYELVEDSIPYLNGYWGNLNVTWGYGLFD